jgi:hypothetical protein
MFDMVSNGLKKFQIVSDFQSFSEEKGLFPLQALNQTRSPIKKDGAASARDRDKQQSLQRLPTLVWET